MRSSQVIAPLERNIKPDEFISFNGGGTKGLHEWRDAAANL